MATYVIGDVQGCFDELQMLLSAIKFNRDQDNLWFTGDLVNRGPKSLAVLRYIHDLPRAVCVLGNHDLALLALAYTNLSIKYHTLDDILQAPDKDKLLTWLRNQPLFYENHDFNSVLVHAGIPPQWSIVEAKMYAEEVSSHLRSDNYIALLENMFGNTPNTWNDNLTKWDRLRFIINALTRMRLCEPSGAYDLSYKGNLELAPPHLIPWYQFPRRQQENQKILFGHWAALEGKVSTERLEALDTGCYWGGQLTALCLENGIRYQVACVR